MNKAREAAYNAEYERLSAIFENMAPNKRELAEGLIQQAARNRVILDECWEDLTKNGKTETRVKNAQGDAVEVERDVSKLFTATDRSYQAQIKMLTEFLPCSGGASKLKALDEDDEA